MIPEIHSKYSAKMYGGKEEDYIHIHQLMDSTKACFPTNKHRALTHNTWFTTLIVPKIYGGIQKNSVGKHFYPKDVCEYHIFEDYGYKFIPSAQDYLMCMKTESWMSRSESPQSFENKEKVKINTITSKEHAILTSNTFGGIYTDYIKIHDLMSSSNILVNDDRHKILTHNTWFINTIIPKIFEEYCNSDGIVINPIDVAKNHVFNDMDINNVPTIQDYLVLMEHKDWMNNNGVPPSCINIYDTRKKVDEDISSNKNFMLVD